MGIKRRANRESVTLPEQYCGRIEAIAGYPVRITSYQLWDTFYAKADIALEGMGGCVARAESSMQTGAETSVMVKAQRLLAKCA